MPAMVCRHNLRVGIQIGHDDMPFGDCRGKLFIGCHQGVVLLVPVVLVEVDCALAYCVKLDGAHEIVEGAEWLSVGIVVILFGNGEETVPSCEGVVAHASSGCELVECVACQKEQVCGF